MKNNTTIINFGPQHPAAHGVFNLVLELDGEIIVRSDPHIGFLHRGTEKLMEYKTYMQGLPYLDRMDYVAPLSQEHCFALAVENLLSLEVPMRAKYIRVLLLELQRIASHLFNITTMALDIGAMTPMLWEFEEREKIMEFFERISGARMHCAYIRVGGVACDIDDDIICDIKNFITALPQKIESMEKLLTENRIFKQRTVSIGKIDLNDAIDFAMSGPMLRACGIAWDLRKSQPYEIYDELDFMVAVANNGDCYDRYLVRILEIQESIKIIKQCINKIPKGDFISNDRKIIPPPREELEYSMEATIHHFKLFSEGFSVPEGIIYTATETPKGEFGVFIVSKGKNHPYRVHFRSPGLSHLQPIGKMIDGQSLSDVASTIGSIDIVFGEIDR